MATKDYSFLTNLLKQLDKRNFAYIDSLTDEELKQVQPYTLLRWFSCVPDVSGLSIYQLLTTLKLNNKYNANNKRLLLKMIAASGIQRELRHQWINPVVKKTESIKRSKKFEKVKELLDLDDLETQIIFKKYSETQINDLLKICGMQDSDIKKL